MNAYYILGRTYKIESLMEKLEALSKLCNITPIDENTIKKSFAKGGPDFEDMVQYESATTVNPDVIITRNIKHFSGISTKVMTPVTFLDEYFK